MNSKMKVLDLMGIIEDKTDNKFWVTFFSFFLKKFLDLFPSCEVELMVRRGLTWKTAPRQCLTVKCPVKHCGESLNVTWCKLLDTNKCEQINCTENVEIRQDNTNDADKLISFLTFKWISISDDGLYRCGLEGNKLEFSHLINISVSGRQFLLRAKI